MTVQNYFILTSAEREEAMSHNTPDIAINPRAVDNPKPGVGINLNDGAEDYGVGAAVHLADMFVEPQRVGSDPRYPEGMRLFLLTKPWATLDGDTIFAPSGEEH